MDGRRSGAPWSGDGHSQTGVGIVFHTHICPPFPDGPGTSSGVEEPHYPWQTRYPTSISLSIWRYACSEREFVDLRCRQRLISRDSLTLSVATSSRLPYGHWLRRQMVGGRLAAAVASDAVGLDRQHPHASQEEWNCFRRRVYEQSAGLRRCRHPEAGSLVERWLSPWASIRTWCLRPPLRMWFTDAELAGWISGRTTEPTRGWRRLKPRQRLDVAGQLERNRQSSCATATVARDWCACASARQLVFHDVRSSNGADTLDNSAAARALGVAGFRYPVKLSGLRRRASGDACPCS